MRQALYPRVQLFYEIPDKKERIFYIKTLLDNWWNANLSRPLIRKPIALIRLLHEKLLELLYKKDFVRNLPNYNAFFESFENVPSVIRNCGYIKCFSVLHDAIPFISDYMGRCAKIGIQQQITLSTSNDFFFCVSENTKKDYCKLFKKINDTNTTTTLLAASSNFKPEHDPIKLDLAKQKYNIPQDKRYVFSLCTIEPRKNLIRAVRCFLDFLNKNKINDLVWVMGGGQWDCFVKEMSKTGIKWDSKYIVRAGYIDDEDLPILYSNAEWFVYTSQYEGFGLPPLEAMQCGCPVITSNNSSLPEVVGNAGILIDWDSDEQHINAYEKYYFNDYIRTEMCSKGIERAKLFSWKKTIDKIIGEMVSQTPEHIEKLNIIYRMCDKVSASSSVQRCFDVSKNKLIKRCLQSLKRNLERYYGQLNFYCIADNCSDDIIVFLKETIPNVILKRFDKIGNAKSFCECVELASSLPNGEQVFFIEDDYLMLNDRVLATLNVSLAQLCYEKQCKVAIMPDDYPDRYIGNSINTECRVTGSGHFLKIDKTTCTFATYTDVVKHYKKHLLKFIKWPLISEDESVNYIWKKVPLYQPIPAWTLHCQEKSIIPKYLDYVHLKKYFENEIEL